jgi:hypothetical protein
LARQYTASPNGSQVVVNSTSSGIGIGVDRGGAHSTLGSTAHSRTHTSGQTDLAILTTPTAIIGSTKSLF